MTVIYDADLLCVVPLHHEPITYYFFISRNSAFDETISFCNQGKLYGCKPDGQYKAVLSSFAKKILLDRAGIQPHDSSPIGYNPVS